MWANNYAGFELFRFYTIFQGIFPQTFFLTFPLARITEVEISIKVRFLSVG
jgi:hypothetical protein